MKKIGILFLVMLLGVSTTMAQNWRGRGGDFNPKDAAKRQTETLKEELGLNKDQEKKVYAITLEGMEKMQAMREEMQGGFSEEMREKMMKVREDQNKEMKKVLTEKQWEKYEKYLEERRARRGQRGPGGNR